MVRPDDQFICKLWKAANKDHTFFGFRFRALHIAELPMSLSAVGELLAASDRGGG